MEVWPNYFLTSTLDGREWLGSIPIHSTPGERFSALRGIRGWVDPSVVGGLGGETGGKETTGET